MNENGIEQAKQTPPPAPEITIRLVSGQLQVMCNTTNLIEAFGMMELAKTIMQKKAEQQAAGPGLLVANGSLPRFGR